MEPDGEVRLVRVAPDVALPCAAHGLPAGRTILLVHAWGESRRSFDRLLPLLPDTLRGLTVDLRGHGDADKPPGGYALDELADDIAALLDGIGVPSAVVVGSSSGGYVAQQLAVSHPGRVDGLVLLGAPRTLQQRPAFATEVERLVDPVDAGWVRQSLTWFPTSRQVPQWYVDDRVADGVRLPAHVWRRTLDGLVSAPPPTEVSTITTPTLVVWGEHDGLLARADEEALAAAIPGSRLLVYEDTGHLVLWEQPERVAADVATFVAGLDPTREMERQT